MRQETRVVLTRFKVPLDIPLWQKSPREYCTTEAFLSEVFEPAFRGVIEAQRKRFYDKTTPRAGFLRTWLGRVVENPEMVIQASHWKSADDFETFKKSEEYMIHWTFISKWSHPFEQVVDKEWAWRPDYYSGLITCWFDRDDMSDELREKVKKLRGLREPCAYGTAVRYLATIGDGYTRHGWTEGSPQEPIKHCPLSLKETGHVDARDGQSKWKGYFRNPRAPVRARPLDSTATIEDTPESHDGKPAAIETSTLFWFVHWTHPDSEKEWKASPVKLWDAFGLKSADLPNDDNWELYPMEHFDIQMCSVGCLGWREEHCQFVLVDY